jgi:hypothetical protein
MAMNDDVEIQKTYVVSTTPKTMKWVLFVGDIANLNNPDENRVPVDLRGRTPHIHRE